MSDRRDKILEAGLAVLRQDGLGGFTQIRVAKRAKLRQGHLTYYFPTRSDLLLGVAEAALAAQLTLLEEALAGADIETAAVNIANTLIRPERARVLIAIAQSADVEPAVRRAFVRFAGEIALRVAAFFKRLGVTTNAGDVVFMQAATVGMALLLLSQKPKDGNAMAATMIERVLRTVLEQGRG